MLGSMQAKCQLATAFYPAERAGLSTISFLCSYDTSMPTAENKKKEDLMSRFGNDTIFVEVYVKKLLKLVLSKSLNWDNPNGNYKC